MILNAAISRLNFKIYVFLHSELSRHFQFLSSLRKKILNNATKMLEWWFFGFQLNLLKKKLAWCTKPIKKILDFFKSWKNKKYVLCLFFCKNYVHSRKCFHFSILVPSVRARSPFPFFGLVTSTFKLQRRKAKFQTKKYHLTLCLRDRWCWFCWC